MDASITCLFCAADVIITSVDARCPLCGRPIGESLAVECLDPTDLSIAKDRTCVGCGYNVRTLPITGQCPECAAPVVDSLRRDDLNVADARWLRGVGRGLLLVAAVQLVSVAFSVAREIVMALAAPRAVPKMLGLLWRIDLLASPFLVAAWALGILGATAAEPRRGLKRSGDYVSRLARLGAIGYLAITVVYSGDVILRTWWIHGLSRFWEQLDPTTFLRGANTTVLFLLYSAFVWFNKGSAVLLMVIQRRLTRRAHRTALSHLLGVLIVAGVTLAVMTTAQWMQLMAFGRGLRLYRFLGCSNVLRLALELLEWFAIVRCWRMVVLADGRCTGRTVAQSAGWVSKGVGNGSSWDRDQ